MAITREGVKGPIAVILLAAGAGSRFGGAKLLAPWRGGLLIDGALRSALAAPASEVMVATGARGQDVAHAALDFADRAGQSERLKIVKVADWEAGLSASLKTAVAALAPRTSAAFVFLADMPLIPDAIPPALASALTGDCVAAIPEVDGELGHPVLLGAELFGRVAELSGDRGARKLLEGLGSRLARVPTSDRNVLLDVDTPAALAQAEGRR
ncbi:MAG: nucleotidyltransferase family protein [Caulobacteraceae bacterium]